MKTINLIEFISEFMIISNKLTNAEIRMLYLLINEPEVINLSQKDFANKIQADRRTINIGLKKLRKYGYISDISFKQTKVDYKNKSNQIEQIINVPKVEIGRSKRFIIGSIIDFYHPSNNNIVINEDFYSFVLGDRRLHKNLKYQKDFITQTIRESYPMSSFYFEKDKLSHIPEQNYNIIQRINYEIITARKSKCYHLNKEKLMEHLYKNFLISEEEALLVIQNDFPNLVIVGNRIKIPKPLLMGKKNILT